MVRAPAGSEDIRAEVAELLGVRADTIDPGSNLIGQGLDSIRMMTLAGRWRRDGIAVDFAALAAAPTIEAWSELVTAGAPAPGADRPAPMVDAAGPAGDPFPLAPMQHAMWVGRQDNQQFGGVAGHLYVEFDGGPVDPDRLRAAATRLARRHPMLRVRFLPDGTQRIPTDDGGDFPVAVVDLRDDLDAERRLEALRDASRPPVPVGVVLRPRLGLLPGDCLAVFPVGVTQLGEVAAQVEGGEVGHQGAIAHRVGGLHVQIDVQPGPIVGEQRQRQFEHRAVELLVRFGLPQGFQPPLRVEVVAQVDHRDGEVAA
ncbi:phosphopantetheine-binding protein, partial [Mycobacterium sp. E3198]|uniref:phosphopantetheine-binding protein n=1 Tax=Mycobacterium sp. E3198 TaxID=1834143 RepID=UPI000A8C5783